MVDKNRRRLIREGSCFCWQCCTKFFQNGLYCQGLFSFRLGLAFPLHVLTMTAHVEGEGGWSVWELVRGLFSPCSYLILLQAVQCFRGEMSLNRRGMKLGAKLVSAQRTWSSPLSLPAPDANGCLQKLAFYSETAEGRQLKMRLTSLLNWKEKKSLLILAFCALPIMERERPLAFGHKRSIDKASNNPTEICSNKS